MSFFGQSSNQQSSGGFGGFGSNNTSGTGFGQSSNTGFGASTANTGGGLFGAANNNTSTNTGFGGFGATGSTSSPFGGTTAFGTNASSGGGMFGSNTATASNSSGFGGFGGNTANTGGSLFGGASKPAFGAQQPSTGGSLFGGGSNGFGSNNQTAGAFGAAAPSSTALATNVAECQGTGSTPFQAFSEKETPSGTQTNHFQSITFMQPYKNYSFEELRLADYNQGRRYGNGSGQAGAFGTNTGFGGFGGQNTTGGFGTNNNNQSTGLFGSQTTSASPFGGATTAASGFGATNTGGGLFGGGAAKPGGFGTAASQPTGGGLFGNTNQSGGFGAQNNTTSTTGGFGSNQGGSLFGNNNNQQKSGFSFGQNNNTSTGTGFGASGNTGFGANNNTSTGGGIFGNNSTNAPFGGGQQQQPASNPFGGFGNNQQNQNQTQNTTAPAFGGFGNNNQQQKPGGLFGSTDNSTNNTGGGLFGNNQNNQQPTTGGGLFGNANTNQTGGSSLFGPKPAATGTGLFGNTTAANTGNTGGGLFGNKTNQNQQNQSGGLFNTGNQQQQKPGGIFGTGTGSNLFGNNNNNQQQGATSSLFGGGLGSTNQQQQSGGLFGTGNNNNTSSLFNNSQQPQQQPQNNPLQAPQAYNASIFDPNPYGNRSIFDGLPPPPQQYTGPIATPIGQKGQPKKPAILPQYRINPHVASRFVTPQKRQGYGFSYSTYGTPSSMSSNVSTPGGLGGSSLLHGSITRSLGKSLSTNNLRRSFDTEGESLLSPGAFSAGSSRYHGTGSLKKLTIDRSLRTDLFSAPPPLPNLERSDQTRQPGILKKKVSFDASTVGGNGDGQNGVQMNGINGVGSTGEASKSPTSEQGSSAPAQPNGYQNGSRDEDAPAQRDMEQVKGNELAVINEDGDHDMQLPEGSRQPLQPSQRDPQPGAYYMKPSLEEVAKMSFEQKKKVPEVCIGREKCGFVTFDRPVNLNEVPMDHIFGEIAQISHRSLTIYPDAATKPAVGKGLNVPSTIYLANSWPRAKDRKTPLYEKSGDRFNKHILRLRKVRDTEFVRYDADTGTWVFKVKHFTTYGLDYEDEGSEGDSFQTSTLSGPPDSPTPSSRLPRAGSTPMPTGTLQDSSLLSSEWSQSSTSPDDTFEFRRKKILPGAFDPTAGFDEEPEQDQPLEMAEIDGDNDSFLDGRSAASAYGNGAPSHRSSTNHLDRSQSLVVRKEQHDMAGSFPNLNGGSEVQVTAPKSLLDDSQAADFLGTPAKREFNTQGDWAEELRRTISPRKQDRQALRESQARVLQYADNRSDSTPKANIKAKALQSGFATAMDLMHSLNPQEPERRKKGKQAAVGQAKAFQV
ncbi:MAG: hypothetical protein LQ339_003922 [Xanthoria mediterranea]|nr:MAG: hypothetical protein LQ339_003922 [Xanthoria mediterranea]